MVALSGPGWRLAPSLVAYVFEADDATANHIPESARGALAPLDADAVRRLRARLLKRLNR